MSETQAVLFKIKDGWTSMKARNWLKKNNLKAIKKVHKTGSLLRYRIKEPEYKYYITKSQKNGINIVIGSNKPFKRTKTKTKNKFIRNNNRSHITKEEKIEKIKDKIQKNKQKQGIKVVLST